MISARQALYLPAFLAWFALGWLARHALTFAEWGWAGTYARFRRVRP